MHLVYIMQSRRTYYWKMCSDNSMEIKKNKKPFHGKHDETNMPVLNIKQLKKPNIIKNIKTVEKEELIKVK